MACRPIDAVPDQEVTDHLLQGGLLRRKIGTMRWYLVDDPKQKISTRLADPEHVVRLIKHGLQYINLYQDLDDIVGHSSQKTRYNPNGKLLVILNDDNCNDPRWQEDHWQRQCCFI